MMDWRRRFSDGWFPAKSKCRDCGLAAAQLLFELLTKRIPAASAIISQGLERWLSSTAMYYAKFFIVSDSQKRAGVMCRDFSRNDTLSVCIRHRFERAELWWRQSFFSCNATVLGDKLSSNRRCRKTPKTLVSQVLLPLKTKGKDKNEGFTYTMDNFQLWSHYKYYVLCLYMLAISKLV